MKPLTVWMVVPALTVAACGAATPPAAPPTFTKDIAPIVFTHCATCHRPGGVGPFPLLTYADVAAHAEDIVHQTRERHMPPWLPVGGDVPIVGDRRLSDQQIATIAAWAESGRPEGQSSDLPAAPAFPQGWEYGQPHAVLTMDTPYIVEPGEDDVYRQLVIRTSAVPALTAGGFVRAIEFHTNGAPIHHAVIRLDTTPASRRRDGMDGQPGFSDMGWSQLDPDGQFIGWAPGRGPIVSAEGLQWRLPPGADLVVEVHVLRSDRPIPVQPSVGVFLTTTPPARRPLTVKMGSKSIDIPPGQRDYVVTDEYTLPVPITLLSVYPHAHYLGDDMRVSARLPDGSTRVLLHIPHWSFHWQQDYRYVTPIALPAGSRLMMRYTFDNSADNPDNPRDPPVRVRQGPKSTDEMAELSLQILTASPEDTVRITREFEERELLSTIAALETRIAEDPGAADNRAALGETYVAAGRPAEAVTHLEAAIRLGDRSGATHSALGMAFGALGRHQEALTQFRRAVAAQPRDEVMHFNLGRMLSELSRDAEAMAAYERALSLNPDFADAHVNLAVLQFQSGKVADALLHYARAAALSPESAVIANNYGSALASTGRFAEAMRQVRRALEIDPGYQPAQDNLQRLQRMGIK